MASFPSGVVPWTNKTDNTNTVVHASDINNAYAELQAIEGSLLNNDSIGTNGYQKLSSGLIIQWGKTGSVSDTGSTTVTFPTPFPNAVFTVVGTNNTSSNAGGNFGSVSVVIRSLSQMDIGHYNNGGNSSPIFWIAIGY